MRSEYVGKINNYGVQEVNAPHKSKSPKKGKVKTGGDLRSGKGRK